MSAPRPQYRLPGGTRVPSVTTVLGVIAKPYLTAWANRLGLRGVDSEAYVAEAAAAGTLAHEWIAHRLAGTKWDSAALAEYSLDEQGMALRAFASFRGWRRAHALEPLCWEQPFVSTRLRVGGTIDLYAELDGRRVLIDFKTSERVNESHLFQLAAYRALLEETGYRVDEVRVVLLPRSGAQWAEEAHEDTSLELAVFEAARALYAAQRIHERARRALHAGERVAERDAELAEISAWPSVSRPEGSAVTNRGMGGGQIGIDWQRFELNG